MTSRSRLKINYFEKGSTALHALNPSMPEGYCCPICLRLYGREALASGMLSIEHAPPESIGGRPVALTCRECNSKAGHTIDSAIAEREKFISFKNAFSEQSLDFKGRVSFQFGGIALNTAFEQTDAGRSFKPVVESNDPKKLKALAEHMEELGRTGDWDGQEFTITFATRYAPRQALIGDLKTAFLLCFALFGYTFAMDARLSSVREQILAPPDKIINRFWVDRDADHIRNRIIMARRPVPALIVSLDHSMIILPYINGSDDFYKHLAEHHAGRIHFTGRFCRWPKTLEMNLDFGNGLENILEHPVPTSNL